MSIFCNSCGNQLEDGASFCNNCGESIEQGQAAPQVPAQTSPQTSAPAGQQQNNVIMPVPTPTYQQQGTTPNYSRQALPPQNNQQPYNQNMQNSDKPVKVGDWVITLVLLSLPCVGIILLFVWGFGTSEPESKRNFCKAYLIFTAVLVALSILTLIVLAIFGFSFAEELKQYR